MTYITQRGEPEVSTPEVIPVPQHTFGHIDCPACEATRGEILTNDPEVFGKMKFIPASLIWLESRRLYLRPRPFYLAGQHIKNLGYFFGEMRLNQIHIGHIRQYQLQRTRNQDQKWAKLAGPSIINHEVSALQQILKRAGEWKKIEEYYEAIPLPRWKPPKVMSDEEEMMLYSIAARNPNWELAFWTSAISVNTGICGVELRNIKLRDLHLEDRVPCVIIDAETAKEEVRGRVVVLNSMAVKMFTHCLKRAGKLGSEDPEHFLFPKRTGPGKWNPNLPATASWLRRPFEGLREAAGMPWLTPHCFRHQHITISFEAGEPDQTIRLRVGHVSERMTRYYSSVRRDTQKVAVDAIDPMKRFGPKSLAMDWLKFAKIS